MKKCVFAGSFDPPTVGHKAVVLSSLKIFDEVVVAVMENTAKSYLLTVAQRLQLLNKIFKDYDGVRVRSFAGAAVDLLKEENTPFYVRGVRDCIDFEYEKRDLFASRRLYPDIVPIFIPAEQEQLQISSTLVRNSLHFDKDWEGYVPKEIEQDLIKMTEKKDV